ncbi:MAG: sialidase family protein, partial [Actinomycetes bacterium]
MRRLVLLPLLTCALVLAGCSATTLTEAGRGTPVEPDSSSAGGRANEVTEETNLTQERLDSLAAAKANGSFGTAPATATRASGWSGEQLLNSNADDWEPALATDPNQPYVYLTTTRYGAGKTCADHCPSPYLVTTISSDGGVTWGDQVPLCICRGSGGQYDPTMEVVPNTGSVYSVFLNGDRAGAYSAAFTKSTDHGQTWTDPVHVYGNVSWTDKPEVTMSPSGKDVYVSWNGPQGGDLYVGVSHDYGETWTHQKLTTSKRYYYAYDAAVLPDG